MSFISFVQSCAILYDSIVSNSPNFDDNIDRVHLQKLLYTLQFRNIVRVCCVLI